MSKFHLIFWLILLLTLCTALSAARSAPDWSLDINEYEFNANIVAVVQVNYEPQSDMSSILGAFCDDECRGTASPVQFEDEALYFLTVYSNQSEETLDFCFYQAGSDLVLELEESIIFQPNQVYGSVLQPLALHAFIDYDNPPLVSDIPDQTIAFDAAFSPVILNDFLSELDGDEVVWTFAGAVNLLVVIENNTAYIDRTDPDWTGSENVTFTAVDQTENGLFDSDTAMFAVLPPDHPPHVNNIPDQTIAAGQVFEPVDLDDYLVEIDNDSIRWDYQFALNNEPQTAPDWIVIPTNYELTMSMTVQVISEGIPAHNSNNLLGAFFDDECRGVAQCQSAMGDWFYFLTVYADSTGENIGFRFFDSDKQKVMGVLEEITFDANGVTGNPLVPFIMQAGNVLININTDDHAVFSIVNADWFGSETIIFSAADQNTASGYSASDEVTLTVLEDHAPQILAIADQIITQGEEFIPIPLNDHLVELDGDDVVWSSSPAGNLEVIINDDNVAIVSVISPAWLGSETVVFTATDATEFAASSSSEVNFTVQSLDHPPAVGGIPDQIIALGMEFDTIHLNDYLTEIDDDQIQWSYWFPPAQVPQNPPDRDIDPNDYEFSMNLTVEVTSEGYLAESDSHLLFAVFQNECRGIATATYSIEKWLYFLTVYSNENGEEIDFEFYDADKGRLLPVLQKIVFNNNQIHGNPLYPVQFQAGYLMVNIDQDSKAEISPADPNWTGDCALHFIAQDICTMNNLSDYDEASFSVINDHAPQISPLADQTIFINESFDTFDLDNYLTELDGDPVLWSWFGDECLQIAIDNENMVTLTPLSAGWTGSETITFRVEDDTEFAAWDTRDVTYTILPEDHPPQVADIPDQAIFSDESYLDLSLYLTELDGDAVAWSCEFLINEQTQPLPDWQLNPTDFQYTMTLTAEIHSKNAVAEGDQHLLAAFMDNQCRGVTSAVYSLDKWLYFLTIYSNNADEQIFLRFYDHNFQQILPVEEMLTFENNLTIGNPLDPLQLSAGFFKIEFTDHIAAISAIDMSWFGDEYVNFIATDQNTIQRLSGCDEVVISHYDGIWVSKDFNAGWNWFSINVQQENMDTDLVLSSLGSSANMIKSQTGAAIFYEGAGWLGSLTQMNNETLYKLDCDEPVLWEFSGYPVSVQETIYDLHAGWNWISYAPQAPEEINFAFAALQQGSDIKTQTAAAVFYAGAGWFGSLNFLHPLDGFMLKMSESEQFVYPEPEQNTRISHITPEFKVNDAHWNLNYTGFEYNSALIIELISDEEGFEPSDYFLGVFCDDECRGIASFDNQAILDYRTELGRIYHLPMVYSNSPAGEIMDIFAYNYLTGETISTDCRFVFNSQKFSGNWQNPLRIYISSTQTDETANPVKLSCSPNPFNPVTTINFSLSEAGEIKINIYNIKGQKVNALKTKNLEPGNHQLIWQGTDQQNRPCASGVYFFLLKAGAKTETCRALLLK